MKPREEALDKLFELAARLTDAMQQGLGERGLTASRAEVLLALDHAGPMVQRQIGEALRCTPRYVTSLIDALEAEGLVKRRAHPTDRRATLVSLTKRGTEAAARMGAEREQAAQWLLGDVDPADLATFVAIADQVLDRIGAALPEKGRVGGDQSDQAGAAAASSNTTRRPPASAASRRASKPS